MTRSAAPTVTAGLRRVFPPTRLVRMAAVGSLALLLAYGILWTQVTPKEIGRSDFTATYVGGLLFRLGDKAQLYDLAAQARLHAAVIAPDREGNLPFVDAPIAAFLAAPITLAGLDAAYRIWGLLQIGVLIAAITIAISSAPWPQNFPARWRWLVFAIVLGGAATLMQLLQAQWSSVSALGLALAYREWRRGRLTTGAIAVVLSAGIAKPHLALGLLAFMIGWRDRRILIGAGIAGLLMLLANGLVAGPSGIMGFLHLAIASNTQWTLYSFVSFVGIPGSFLGNAGPAQVVGAVGDIVALMVAGILGSSVRKDVGRLELALAGSAALSILAAPHALIYDLVFLAPAMAWCAPVGLTVGPRGISSWNRRGLTLFALWFMLSAGVFVTAAGAAFEIVPWVLIIAVGACWANRDCLSASRSLARSFASNPAQLC